MIGNRLGPPIPFILIPDPLQKCLAYFIVVGSHMSVSLLHRYLTESEWQVWRGEVYGRFVTVAPIWQLDKVEAAETHYTWWRPAMSMKWVGWCQNNKQKQDTSLKLTESPTATVTVRPSIYQVQIVLLWQLATVEGHEIDYLCMK